MAAHPIIALLLFGLATLFARDDRGHLLFLLSRGDISEALSAYQSLPKEDSLVEEMGLTLLYQGIRSNDKETQMFALIGASLSMSRKAERIYEMGYESSFVEVQAASLQAIAQTRSDHARFLIEKGIGHAHPLVRLQAALLMAKLRLPGAAFRIESLMNKWEPELHFIFPELFAEIEDVHSLRLLKKLLNHSEKETRLAALTTIGTHKLEPLQKEVRSLLLHPDFREQEAALFALIELKDEGGRESYQHLLESTHPNVKLYAHFALLKIGDRSHEKFLLAEMGKGNPFAFGFAKDCENALPILEKLAQNGSFTLKANLALPLLQMKGKGAVKVAKELLALDIQKQLLFPVRSPGGTLECYKLVDSASVKEDELPILIDLTLQLKEEILIQLATFPENDFFSAVQNLVERDDRDLISLALRLVKNLGSEKAGAFLSELEQRAGSPYTRALASLARLTKAKENYSLEKVKKWILSEDALTSIGLKESRSVAKQGPITPYEVTPEARSELFLEALLTLVQENPSYAVEALLELLAKAPPKLRPLLAGFLLKAAE